MALLIFSLPPFALKIPFPFTYGHEGEGGRGEELK